MNTETSGHERMRGAPVDLVANNEWQTVELNGEETEIPSGWKSKNLSSVAKISKGKQVDFSFAKEKNKDTPHPYINGGKNPSGYSQKHNTKANTIAISEGGASAGFVQFVNNEWWCGGHCYAIDAIHEDNKALYWILKYNETFIMDKKEGTGLPNLKIGSLAGIELKIPPLSQQTLIAKLLTAQEEHIENLRSRASIERNKLAFLSDELLSGRIRVSVDEGGPETVVERDENGNVLETLPCVKLEANTEWQTVELNGEEAEIPVGWEITSLGNALNFISGYSFKGTDFANTGEFGIIRIRDIFHQQPKFYLKGGVLDKMIWVNNGDLVIGMDGDFNVVEWESKTALLNQRMLKTTTNPKEKSFFKNVLNNILFKINHSTAATTVKHLSAADLKKHQFACPSSQEKYYISTILSTQENFISFLDIQITIEEKKLAWLSDELLNGRILIKEKL